LKYISNISTRDLRRQHIAMRPTTAEKKDAAVQLLSQGLSQAVTIRQFKQQKALRVMPAWWSASIPSDVCWKRAGYIRRRRSKSRCSRFATVTRAWNLLSDTRTGLSTTGARSCGRTRPRSIVSALMGGSGVGSIAASPYEDRREFECGFVLLNLARRAYKITRLPWFRCQRHHFSTRQWSKTYLETSQRVLARARAQDTAMASPIARPEPYRAPLESSEASSQCMVKTTDRNAWIVGEGGGGIGGHSTRGGWKAYWKHAAAYRSFCCQYS